MQYNVIGNGRIGQTVANIASQYTVQILERHTLGTVPLLDGPICVCTRNDDLDIVLRYIPEDRYQDLIFVQNGMVETWIEQNQCASSTRAVLYFAVSKKGDAPVDGKRTVVMGPHAHFFQDLLAQGNIACTIVDAEQYKKEVMEKFVWNCTFGVLSTYFQCSVGDVVEKHHDNFLRLATEQISLCSLEMHIELSKGEESAMLKRLAEYSLSIYEYQGAVKEWAWRNGWLVARDPNPESYHNILLASIQR